MRFTQGKHCIYNIGYHVIWVPKYRKALLTGTIKEIIEESILEKSKELNIFIEKYEIMPDHIHIFMKCNPNQHISKIIGQLKGYSSYKLRSKYTKYRKYKSFWAPSYYCESVGHISEETVKKYIEKQWEALGKK